MNRNIYSYFIFLLIFTLLKTIIYYQSPKGTLLCMYVFIINCKNKNPVSRNLFKFESK